MSSSAATAADSRGVGRTAVGWLLLLGSIAYTLYLHQGLAGPPGGAASEWWHPTRFLMDTDFVGSREDSPLTGVLLLALPAALLGVGVFWGTGSAVARMLSLSNVFMVGLFAFYSFSSPRIWSFFGWRGSAVMVMISLAIAAAIVAPLFARSLLRLPGILQATVYGTVVLGIIAQLRNATGTDERLAFNLSPWPAVSIFGLEIGAYAVVGVLIGLAFGALGFAFWSTRRLLAAGCIALGALAPAVWLLSRFGSLPSGGGVALAVATPVILALVATTRGGSRRQALLSRAFYLALGAILVAMPLLSGRALATGDYTVTRFIRAQELINALQSHFHERDEYPDELAQLIEHGYLESIPQPRVGFESLNALAGYEPSDFHYQSLGSSYVLEFISTEWVQCAYNPPWEDDEEYDEEYEDEYADEGDEANEAWSCPETRPELW